MTDMVILEFNQYTPGSRWRQTMINRKHHREEGNEIDGVYGGIRKLHSKEEITRWKNLWPTKNVEWIAWLIALNLCKLISSPSQIGNVPRMNLSLNDVIPKKRYRLYKFFFPDQKSTLDKRVSLGTMVSLLPCGPEVMCLNPGNSRSACGDKTTHIYLPSYKLFNICVPPQK